MKREEAQFILTAYRPNGEDALDSEFADSLRMAEADPELAKWFAQEQAMDRFVCDKLREIQPPAGLRDRILTGGRVSHQIAWFRQTKWMALAAALLVFALVGTYFLRPVGGNSFPEFAMNYASRGFLLQDEGNDLNKLTSWLAAKNMPTPVSVPERLAALEKLGCRTVNFEGREVSIICFKSDREYHLFVAKKTSQPLYAALSGRQMASSGKWSAAAWSDSENDYVLASEGDQKSLERLL